MKSEKPCEGNSPTIPILRLLLGRPRRTFFSCGGAFFGGILFLREASATKEREKDRGVWYERLGLAAQRLSRLNRSLISKVSKKRSHANAWLQAPASNRHTHFPLSLLRSQTHPLAHPTRLHQRRCHHLLYSPN